MGGGREVQEGGDIQYTCGWFHVDTWQKPTQYWRAIILQLKKNFLKWEAEVFKNVTFFYVYTEKNV